MFLAPSFVRPRKGIMSRENGNFIVIYFERNEELCVLVCLCVCFSGEREGESDRFKGEREESNEDSSHADRPDRVWQVSQRQCPEKQEETTPEDERRKTKKIISLIRSRYTSREALAPPIFQKTKKKETFISTFHTAVLDRISRFSPVCIYRRLASTAPAVRSRQ